VPVTTLDHGAAGAESVSGWIDISRPLGPRTPVWPGDRPVELERLEVGFMTVTSFTTSCHVGTHLDAPLHVDPNGTTAYEVPLGRLVGPAEVIHLPARCRLARTEDLPLGWQPRHSKILLRTDSHPVDADIDNEFTALDPELVEWLSDRGVQTIGIDTPSVDPFDSAELPAHRALLGRRMTWIEGLDLEGVGAGSYELLALPMALCGTDAAPLRAVLRRLPERDRTSRQPG
jgi:arylformamidase